MMKINMVSHFYLFPEVTFGDDLKDKIYASLYTSTHNSQTNQ